MQNIGLTISPLIAGSMLKTKKDGGYFWYFVYFEVLAVIGICLNLWLYMDDLKYRGGILNKVDKGEELADLMATPRQDAKSKARQMREELAAKGDEGQKAALLEYKLDDEARASLRRSVARNSMAATK